MSLLNRYVWAILLVFALVSCPLGSKKPKDIKVDTSKWPSVTLRPVRVHTLHRTLRYGGYLEPKAVYSVTQPVDAIIRQIPIRIGQMVSTGMPLYSFQQIQPGTNYNTGWVFATNSGKVALINGVVGRFAKKNETILQICDTSTLVVNCFLSNQDISYIQQGQHVYLGDLVDEVDDLKGDLYAYQDPARLQRIQQAIKEKEDLLEQTKGTVTRLSLIPAEKNTGVFPVQIEFQQHPSFFLGRFVVLELRVDPYEGIAIEQRYLVERYGKQQVTMVHNDIAEYHEVETGRIYGNMIEIKSGLVAGDKIVTQSNRYIRPGMHVQTTEAGGSRK